MATSTLMILASVAPVLESIAFIFAGYCLIMLIAYILLWTAAPLAFAKPEERQVWSGKVRLQRQVLSGYIPVPPRFGIRCELTDRRLCFSPPLRLNSAMGFYLLLEGITAEVVVPPSRRPQPTLSVRALIPGGDRSLHLLVSGRDVQQLIQVLGL
jgi:hypothetical protein